MPHEYFFDKSEKKVTVIIYSHCDAIGQSAVEGRDYGEGQLSLNNISDVCCRRSVDISRLIHPKHTPLRTMYICISLECELLFLANKINISTWLAVSEYGIMTQFILLSHYEEADFTWMTRPAVHCLTYYTAMKKTWTQNIDLKTILLI